MAAFLVRFLTKVAQLVLLAAIFNQCIVTRYPVGAGIGWHADANLFGDRIMAVSTGTPGMLEFRPHGNEDPTFELLVAPGSLYVIHGPALR